MDTTKSGTYKKGKQSATGILDAASKLLIDAGYSSFSLRKVADSAGISLGNLQYYFPNKDSLIEAMLDKTIQVYLDDFEEIRHHGDAREQLTTMVQHVVADLSSKTTTIFFPELWSLSNHDKKITKHMDKMYSKYRQYYEEIIADINPKLSEAQIKRLALFFSASLEGHTMFIGYRKPWTEESDNTAKMAVQSFLWMIEHGDIPD
jgi:AcrR family transcriptional regulator